MFQIIADQERRHLPQLQPATPAPTEEPGYRPDCCKNML
jgi:hypothetical protein